MLRLNGIIGNWNDADVHDRIHALEHADAIEYLYVSDADRGRRRLRLETDRGSDCAIALDRDEVLADGAILFLQQERAIIVRIGAPVEWRLVARDMAAALKLGFTAGHLHWRVRFEGTTLIVSLDGDEASYRARIADLLHSGAVAVVADGG